MQNLYIDIETIPAQRPEILEEIRAAKLDELEANIAAIAPPGNYKKAETIAEWMAEQKPKIEQTLRDEFEASVEDEYRKTSLDGAFGQICVIGVASDDFTPEVFFGMDEANVLKALTGWLNARNANPFNVTVVGHNVVAFDLRFLVQRHIVNGIKPHPVIARAAQAKPWEVEKVFDTMAQWSGIGARISLDKLCKALNVPTPKGDIDGSKVWDFVRDGRLREVADYCIRDVEAVRTIHQLMTFQALPVAA